MSSSIKGWLTQGSLDTNYLKRNQLWNLDTYSIRGKLSTSHSNGWELVHTHIIFQPPRQTWNFNGFTKKIFETKDYIRIKMHNFVQKCFGWWGIVQRNKIINVFKHKKFLQTDICHKTHCVLWKNKHDTWAGVVEFVLEDVCVFGVVFGVHLFFGIHLTFEVVFTFFDWLDLTLDFCHDVVYHDITCHDIIYVLMSYILTSYVITSYFMTSFAIMSYIITTYVMRLSVMMSYGMTFHVITLYVIISYMMASYVLRSHVMTSHVMASHVMTSYAITP